VRRLHAGFRHGGTPLSATSLLPTAVAA
jgi:hypothetical protein